jgi:hypothetical protein
MPESEPDCPGTLSPASCPLVLASRIDGNAGMLGAHYTG